MLVIACLLLCACTTTEALKDWSYVEVANNFGVPGTLRLKVPLNFKSIANSKLGTILIETSEGILNSTNDEPLAQGQWYVVISPVPKNLIQLLGSTADDVLDRLKSPISFYDNSASFGNTELVEMIGYKAFRVTGTNIQGDTLMAIVEMDKAYLVINALTASGEKDLFEPVLLSMIKSAEYIP